MTTIYSEFIGKEPTLNELHTFVSNNQELFEGIETNVISRYLEFADKHGGYYYIGGQIKTQPDDRIIIENIEKAKKINENAVITHQMEYFSLIRSKNELVILDKILDIYYEYKLAEYYAPPIPGLNNSGGEGYKKVAETTMVGKKWVEYLQKYV
jgi:hypothetical protein